MAGNERRSRHLAELERSRRRWNFWSGHWGVIERDTVEIRRETIGVADLGAGDTVLDFGCGPGVNFELLREVVGSDGTIIAVDLSGRMLDRARARVEGRGWPNVLLVQADATQPVVASQRLDGAVATTAVSATPAVRRAVANVFEALRPGARFALYDIRLVPSGTATVFNPVIEQFYRRFGNWNATEDVVDALQSTFDHTEIIRTFALGTNYIAVAEKGDARPRNPST